jgi:hypothetical protein
MDLFRRIIDDVSTINVVIATTKWDVLVPEVAEKRHKQLRESDKYLRLLEESGAKIMKCEAENSTNILVAAATIRSDKRVILRDLIARSSLLKPRTARSSQMSSYNEPRKGSSYPEDEYILVMGPSMAGKTTVSI